MPLSARMTINGILLFTKPAPMERMPNVAMPPMKNSSASRCVSYDQTSA